MVLWAVVTAVLRSADPPSDVPGKRRYGERFDRARHSQGTEVSVESALACCYFSS